MPNIPDRGSNKPAEVRIAAVSSPGNASANIDGAHYAKNPFMEKLSVTKFNYPVKAVARAMFNQDDR
jgi:hypothetical protein